MCIWEIHVHVPVHNICIIMKTINAYLESTSLDDTHSETDLGLSNIPVSCRAALFVGYVCLVVNG